MEKRQQEKREQRLESPKQSIVVDGLKRTYNLHVPANLNLRRSGAPLVLAFHGGGGEGHGMYKLTRLDDLSDKAGFICVCPDGIQRHWNDGRKINDKQNVDDVKFVSALISSLESRYKIDSKRIYATGISNGGFFCERLALDIPDKIAAIAIVAATKSAESTQESTAPHAMPVMFVLGTKDPLVPWDGGKIGGFLGDRGQCLPAMQAINFWLTNNRISSEPIKTTLPATYKDGTEIEKIGYYDPESGNDVLLYKVNGGGHCWPGGRQYAPKALIGTSSKNFDASEAIWSFFFSHKKKL